VRLGRSSVSRADIAVVAIAPRFATVFDVLSAREIVTFNDSTAPAGESPLVSGRGPAPLPELVLADPAWPSRFAWLAAEITGALGDSALAVEHVGSTAVPDLPAKPVVDIDLTVADSREEPAYVPALEWRGFVLVVRKPWWYEHRLLHRSDPACNLHVFSPDCAETERHRIFRDWLRAHPEDRSAYAAAKTSAAQRTRATGGHTMDYNAGKEPALREIYDRAFRALGLRA
jgi:GrpB-like predicted nucleotidyltransferase (UPF0157 family)